MKLIDRKLIKAAAAGDAKELERLLASGANPKASNDAGYSALHKASELGHLDCAKLLWDVSAHYAECHCGFSPLILAANRGRTEVVAYMCERLGKASALDSDKDAFKKTVWIAALMAAESNHLNAMRTLAPWVDVAIGDNVSVYGTSKMTPLMMAAAEGNLEAAELCLELGWGAPEAKDSDGETALLVAARCGEQEMVEWLLARCGGAACAIEAVEQYGRTALRHAAERADVRSVAALLGAGASLGDGRAKVSPMSVEMGWNGNGPEGAWPCVEMLLSAGGDPLGRNERGETLLMRAVRCKDLERAKTYMTMCPKDAADYDGWTALHFAAHVGSRVLVELLADEKSCLVRNKNGNTPLMLAVVQGRHAAAHALMELSDIHAKNKAGETALLIAIKGERLSLAKSLKKRGADAGVATKGGYTGLTLCARANLFAMCEAVCQGVALDRRDGDGWTDLMHAARYDNEEMLARLLAMGADRLAVDEVGRGALAHACRSKSLKAAAILVDEKSARQADEDGRTPLMLAARSGRMEMVKLLMPHSDLAARDERGYTAGEIAANEGEKAIAEALACYELSKFEALEIGAVAHVAEATRGSIRV